MSYSAQDELTQFEQSAMGQDTPSPNLEHLSGEPPAAPRPGGPTALRTLGDVYLTFSTLLGFGTALYSGLAPGRFSTELGLRVADAGGVNEIRSQYGGFFLAVAVLCVSTLLGRTSRRTAYTLLATLFGGLAGGRLVSLVANGGVTGVGPVVRTLCVFDAAAFLAACVLLIAERRSAF